MEQTNKIEVTAEQFKRYVKVQESGVTNMFAVNTVSMLTGLDKETIFTIMENYSELMEKYNLA